MVLRVSGFREKGVPLKTKRKFILLVSEIPDQPIEMQETRPVSEEDRLIRILDAERDGTIKEMEFI